MQFLTAFYAMTRNDIIKAAFKVWGRELYQTTSLSHLTRELGVSKPALYRHFKNKQDLINVMHSAFYDDFAAFLSSKYDEVFKIKNKTSRCFYLNQLVTEYYIRNRDLFVFSLIQVYMGRNLKNSGEELRLRGINLEKIVDKKDIQPDLYPPVLRLTATTTLFWIALFHRFDYQPDEEPGEELIQRALDSVKELIAGGLGLAPEKVDAIDYAALESHASLMVYEDTEENKLLRAVAGAVAEAGPWNASMEMVARRSGLSKSGLYAHFKSKQEMIARLFITEFERIVNYARMNIKGTETPEEQLYLVIISIVYYLRSRPEILTAMDWLKTRRLNLEQPPACSEDYPQIYRVITDINLEVLRGQQGPKISQWILFMIVNTLMRSPKLDFESVSNESFRILYRFITLGLKGVRL
jgi:AcrR family transcriptional regulator